MTVTVLVVEADAGFVKLFCDCVQNDPRLLLGGCVGTVAEAIALFDTILPDVLLLSLDLPDENGVHVIRHAKAHHPACEVLVVTRLADDRSIAECIRAGATGYLVKDASLGDVAEAVLQVSAGGAPLSVGVARRLLAWLRNSAGGLPEATWTPNVPAPAHPILSAREMEILHLVAKGLNFKEVGHVLAISPYTVTTHVKRIYQKLAVHSRGEAVYEAGRMGLL